MTTTDETTALVLDADAEARAQRLHRESLVIDASGVVACEPEHFERTAAGGVDVVNHTVARPGQGLADSLAAINACRRWIDANSGKVRLGLTAQGILDARSEGKESIVLGPQHSEFLGTDLSRVGTFADLGVRVIQLTYQTRNWIGDGCGEPNPGGLSRFGRDVVAEMDRVGVVVDLSHVSHPTSFDAIEAAAGPVILSHAHPAAVTPHVRAKSDDLIKALADKGGVIGLTALSPFNALVPGRWPGLNELRVHFEHLLELVGPDHVGIGFDFDETISYDSWLRSKKANPELATEYSFEQRRIRDLQDSSDALNVTRVLVSIGLDDETIAKILGLNFLRVFAAVWQ
ncbi:hypothetical protein G1H11_14420 [Phytoactinopolyspora alkaliphila]|uniref:Membrane dipeptidase n=1 Tax=Phytoactinopolyspora alkaliphila TaxID=1783498 RepID=A0A6N9YN58_9ACTN|nr:membrane dipeptidase [Phytoactinopolyspora alkaliphila]NED96501.1 hypothetical protein [Phytoactinopolyspora alkaliphila]